MQHNKKTLGEKCYIAITGTVWVAGLLIAGSDNIYMPWINGMGLVLFLVSSILLGKLLRPSDSGSSVVIFPKSYPHPGARLISSAKKNCRINIRCAAGVQ